MDHKLIMNADDVRGHLSKAIKKAGGLRRWARKFLAEPGYVSKVLSGVKEPGPSICVPLGIEQVTTYRWVKK